MDLSNEAEFKPPKQVYKCHGGKVVDIAACSFAPFLVSFGEDGRLFLYNYEERKLVYFREFSAKGTCMIWLPTQVYIYI